MISIVLWDRSEAHLDLSIHGSPTAAGNFAISVRAMDYQESTGGL